MIIFTDMQLLWFLKPKYNYQLLALTNSTKAFLSSLKNVGGVNITENLCGPI